MILGFQVRRQSQPSKWNADGDSKGSCETDAAGRCVIAGLTEQAKWITLSAKAKGMVPLDIYWNKPKPDAAAGLRNFR